MSQSAPPHTGIVCCTIRGGNQWSDPIMASGETVIAAMLANGQAGSLNGTVVTLQVSDDGVSWTDRHSIAEHSEHVMQLSCPTMCRIGCKNNDHMSDAVVSIVTSPSPHAATDC
jgi:hypothetical protein